MNPDDGVTPAEVAKRLSAMDVIADPAAVWSYLRARFSERYPERASALPAARLPVSEHDLVEWLEDFLDGVEVTRAQLVRRMNQDPGRRA